MEYIWKGECVLRASRTKRGEGAPDAWALKASSSHTLGPALATLLISFVPLARTISQNLPSFVENRPESPWNSVMSGDKTFAATPRTGENWRERKREVKGRRTGERKKGEKRKINVEGGKRRVRSFRGNGIKNHLGFTLANCGCCNRSLSSSSRFLILRIARDSRKMIRGEDEMLENANSGKLVAGVITFFNVILNRGDGLHLSFEDFSW